MRCPSISLTPHCLLFTLLCLTSPLGVASCGDSSGTSELSAPSAGAPPALHFPPRGSSAPTEHELDGSAAVVRSDGAVDDGTALELFAAGEGLEYAQYRFNPGGEPPNSVTVALEGAVGGGVWLLLGDYGSERWVSCGLHAQDATLSMGGADFVSPDGNVWIALLAQPGAGARIGQVLVRSVVDGEQPPLAELSSPVPSAATGGSFELDATNSGDADGTLEDYEWDFDGDCVFNEDGAELEARGSGVADAPAGDVPGIFDMSVRVTDDDGLMDTAELSVTVREQIITVVDSAGRVGYYISMAQVNGAPAISYYDPDNGDLKYAYTADPDGSGGWNTVVVDSEGDVGWLTSLAEINGKPAISYWDKDNNDLKYAYSSSNDGSSGWSAIVVDSQDLVGQDSSLKLVDGHPAISYWDGTNSDLKFAISSSPSGASGWSTSVVDSDGDVGQHTSLAVVDGVPAISYWDSTNRNLKYAFNSVANGSGEWTALTVDSGDDVGREGSLAVVNGFPAISYWDDGAGAPRYAYSSSARGEGNWTSVIIDSSVNLGVDTSLVELNGRPAVAYSDFTLGDLKYAVNDAADGTGVWQIETLDSANNVGSFCSLALINGDPAIGYRDRTEEDLKYTFLPQ